MAPRVQVSTAARQPRLGRAPAGLRTRSDVSSLSTSPFALFDEMYFFLSLSAAFCQRTGELVRREKGSFFTEEGSMLG